MAFWLHASETEGVFTECEHGLRHEYSVACPGETPWYEYAHKLFVADGFRWCKVLKTRVYVVVDEDEYGSPVVEKWCVRSHHKY